MQAPCKGPEFALAADWPGYALSMNRVISFTVITAGLLLLAAQGSPPTAPASLPGDELADGLAIGVGDWLDASIHADQFHTASPLFDEEWMFGTWMMAAVGFGQHAAANPDARAADLLRMEACLDVLVGEDGTRFEKRKWGVSPLADLDDPARGHAAWLGYANLALAVHHEVVLSEGRPDRFADLHDRVSDALVARLKSEIIETYPGEAYPVDNAAGFGSLGLASRTAADPERALVLSRATEAASRRLVASWRAPGTGLLLQWIHPGGAAKASGPGRGSGTFLASWFLSFGSPSAAHALYRAGRDYLYEPLGPLGAMREYPFGDDGAGDIDSGPLIFGRGVSATAFAIGAARANGDADTARALLRTATLFGAPSEDPSGAIHFRSAGAAMCGAESCGALGDAILFAMVTTPAGTRI